MEKKTRKHFDLEEMLIYIRPQKIKEKCEQSNFRRACKKLSLIDGQFMFNNRIVIMDDQQRKEIIIVKDVHNGLGETPHAKAMASHRGINTTHDKVSSRFLWYSMRSDIIDFINRCDLCQKQGD